MPQGTPPDASIAAWLRTAGVQSLCQWDVLVFLDRHQASLVGAEYLAHLLGYATEPVVVALDALESLGLVERSRLSQGARLYLFTMPSDPPRGKAFRQLLALADHRAGRLLLAKQLRRGEPPRHEELATTRSSSAQSKQVVRPAQQPSRQLAKGRKTWQKAI